MTTKLTILLFNLLLLSACGQPQKRVFEVESELVKYVEQFESDYNLDVNIPIKFDNLDNPVVGLCKVRGSHREILVDYEYYVNNKDNYYTIHQLVYHELGHCVFNLKHNDSKDSNGYPLSIMNSYIFGQYSYYKYNLSSYLEQLWNMRSSQVGITIASKYVECEYMKDKQYE